MLAYFRFGTKQVFCQRRIWICPPSDISEPAIFCDRKWWIGDAGWRRVSIATDRLVAGVPIWTVTDGISNGRFNAPGIKMEVTNPSPPFPPNDPPQAVGANGDKAAQKLPETGFNQLNPAIRQT